MLTLKLLLVPVFLLLVSLAGKRWGPSIAGWLAGLPIVAGPIVFFIALERGEVFASVAASAALAAVFASVSFSVAYSHASVWSRWPAALLLALCAWGIAVALLSVLPSSAALSFAIAAATLLAAPRMFPAVSAQVSARAITRVELSIRMVAGALLTVSVTVLSSTVGSQWSGLLAVFPVLGIVLAVFSHRSQGHAFSSALLRSMATGLYSFVAFCLVLSVALPSMGTPVSFVLAVAISLAVQLVTKRYLSLSSSGQLPASR